MEEQLPHARIQFKLQRAIELLKEAFEITNEVGKSIKRRPDETWQTYSDREKGWKSRQI